MKLFPHFQRLTRVGVTADLSRSDARHVVVTNSFMLIGLAIILGLAIKNVLFGHPAFFRLGLIEFVVTLILPISLLFNHQHRYFLAANWAFFCVLGMNLMGTYLVGRDAGLQLTLPALVIVPLHMYQPRHNRAAVVMAVFTTIVVGLAFTLVPRNPAFGPPLDPQMASAGFTTSVITLCIILGALSVLLRRATQSAEQVAEQEYQRAEDLLLNVLPASIAERLKKSTQTIADRAPEVTVLFADIVGFTPLAQTMLPEELLALLDEVFSAFDLLADKHGLEKIKTIGDAYMVAGGVPEARDDHTQAVALMALEMLVVVRKLSLQLRIGLHTGPVVAGVIGRRKFSYDLWGDTVNTASRLESHGTPGRIQVAAATYHRLSQQFDFEHRGTITIKGKGEMETWYLLAKKLGAGQCEAGVG